MNIYKREISKAASRFEVNKSIEEYLSNIIWLIYKK